MKIPIGKSGNLVLLDFEMTSSLLITGYHSTGKTTLIHYLIKKILEESENNDLKIKMADANKIEFFPYLSVRKVRDVITSKGDLLYEMSEYISDEKQIDGMEFFIIDDLDYFGFGEFDEQERECLFEFIKKANQSKNLKVIVGCSYIPKKTYEELGIYFNSKILFQLPPDYNWKKLVGLSRPLFLGNYEYVALINKNVYGPVKTINIDHLEIEKTTDKFSIYEFKEYENTILRKTDEEVNELFSKSEERFIEHIQELLNRTDPEEMPFLVITSPDEKKFVQFGQNEINDIFLDFPVSGLSNKEISAAKVYFQELGVEKETIEEFNGTSRIYEYCYRMELKNDIPLAIKLIKDIFHNVFGYYEYNDLRIRTDLS